MTAASLLCLTSIVSTISITRKAQNSNFTTSAKSFSFFCSSYIASCRPSWNSMTLFSLFRTVNFSLTHTFFGILMSCFSTLTVCRLMIWPTLSCLILSTPISSWRFALSPTSLSELGSSISFKSAF